MFRIRNLILIIILAAVALLGALFYLLGSYEPEMPQDLQPRSSATLSTVDTGTLAA